MKKEEKILHLRDIKLENKRNRHEAKIIKSFRRNFIRDEKIAWKEKTEITKRTFETNIKKLEDQIKKLKDQIKKLKDNNAIDQKDVDLLKQKEKNLKDNKAKFSLWKKKNKKDFNNKFSEGIAENKKGNIIDIKGLQKYFCNNINCEHILHNVDIEIKKGEVVVILGASGSGKTTLLNIMSGLLDPTLGEVVVAGKDMMFLSDAKKTKFRSDNVSFVFQSYNLIPTLTVVENIKVGENLRNPETDPISIHDILKTLKLIPQARKYPFQLSGGQNQRISIGRALAKNPQILFADEPTGALDEERGKEALQLLLDINKKYKCTLIMVTHNPNFKKLADKVLHIKNGHIDSIIVNKKKSAITDVDWS